MSSRDNLCSPLLERLWNLQRSHKECALLSSDYLSKIKSPPAAKPESAHDKENEKLSSGLYLGDRLHATNKDRAVKKDLRQNAPLLELSNLRLSEDHYYEITNNQDTPARHNYATDYKISEASDLKKKEEGVDNLNPSQEYGTKPARFKYLKKGQGISRFKTKPFKGFKKTSNENNYLPKSRLEVESNKLVSSVDPSQNSSEELINKKLSSFEKLEGLVEQESFCSTSSKVIELLQDEGTFCSTPVSAKASFIGTMELTPITRVKRTDKRSMFNGGKSPVRNLFSPAITSNLEEKESSNQVYLSLIKPKINSNLIEVSNGASAVQNNQQCGILKKSTPNFSPVLKVKFLEQGAKILEYDESQQFLNESSTFCSNDSDLISVSDLENLALLNFRVDVVHETTLPHDTSVGHIPKGNIFLDRNSIFESETIKHPPARLDTNNPAPQMNLAQPCLPKLNLQDYSSKSKIKSTKPHSSIENEDLEIKAHKILLLSKVDDLKKEVDIFKTKNKKVEELIAELKLEKENLIKKQKEIPEQENKIKRVSCIIKPKRSISRENERDKIVVSMKQQELNGKLNKLEAENNRLKMKIITLEKREKAIKNNRNEAQNISDNKPEKDQKCTIPSGREKKTVDFSVKPKQPIRKLPSERLTSKPNLRSVYQPANEQNRRKSIPESKDNNSYSPSTDEGPSVPQMQFKMSDDQSSPSGTNSKSFLPTRHKFAKAPLNLFTIEEEVEKEIKGKVNFGVGENTLSELGRQPLTKPFDEIVNVNREREQTRHNVNFITSKIPEDSIEIVDVFGANKSNIEYEMGTEIEDGGYHYPNGDKKIIDADKIVYHYAKDNVIHTKYKADGKEEIEFVSGQREIYFKDGSYQIILADHSSKTAYKDGSEVCVWKDGTVIRVNSDGSKVVHFPNGQKEVYENGTVRRVYPDGTLKILHQDGRQETRYKNGRIRIKDRDGNVSMYKNN